MKKEKRKPSFVKTSEGQGKKVVVAMSGGVDSSVAAALLKKQGYDVIGAFMRFWKEPGHGENRCCSPDSERRARKVAKILDIPFYVFNFEKEFKKRIVDYFLKENKEGDTPNPCVVCNKEIKFGLLLEKALKLGSDYMATGHYARLKREGKNCKLLKGKDKNKDQSYFLWQLDQKQLKKILFPVGDYTRAEVEKLAQKFQLPFANVKKSMEICFIPKTINDFLKKYLKPKPGQIVDKQGKLLGKHQGLHFFTIGQRRGIGLNGGPASAKATAGKPYYVLDKDFKKNLLIVTENEKDLYKNGLSAENINWICNKKPKFPLKVKTKIRYRHTAAPAVIYKIKNIKNKEYKIKILFNSPQRAITPGQSVVFYRGQELLGGGIIN